MMSDESLEASDRSGYGKNYIGLMFVICCAAQMIGIELFIETINALFVQHD